MAKTFDPKAKAKRQKIMAAVGGVLLLALLAIQVPRTMKMMNAQNATEEPTPTATATTPTTGSTSSLAPPTLSGGAPATATAATAESGDGLFDPDAPSTPASGQLIAFGRFQSKDPFAQQVSATAAPGAGSEGSSPPSSGAAPSVQTSPPPPPSLFLPITPTPTRTASPPPAKPTSARIAVNGVVQTVQVGRTFPESEPLFRLVSLTRKAARIAISDGSYENGAPTVALGLGKTLTLMNTADGARYQLRLVGVS